MTTKPAEEPLDEDVTDMLASPPSSAVDPPLVTAPDLLPIRQLPWPDFEKLVRALAERSRGLLHVRCYGRPGQRQYGIDVYGTRPVDSQLEVLQARNVEKVSAAYVRKTVAAYIRAGRRFSADTFVLCVGVAVADTAIDNELVKLRQAHGLGIELWDASRMSDLLRPLPDTVERFFGPTWRSVFCGGGDGQPATIASDGPSVDSLLLGPVKALGLESLAATAASNSQDPALALDAAGRLETALQAAGHDSVAWRWRERRAALLAGMGETASAFDLAFELAVHELATDPSRLVATLLHRLEGDVDQVRSERRQALRSHAEWWEHRGELATLRSSAAHLLTAGDPWASNALLWHLEAALVDRDRPELRLAMEHLSAAIGAATDPRVKVRLQAAGADAAGATGWGRLFLAAASRTMPAAEAGYLCARAGRWYAWSDQPEEAQAAYRRAIELAIDARLPGDASYYLKALDEVRVRAGLLDTEGEDRAHAARALSSGATFLGLDGSTRSAAMSALADGRLPDARDLLHRLLWEALVTGQLRQELEAHRRLGDLYAQSDELPASTYHLALAGQAKQAAAIAKQLSRAVTLDELDIEPARWHRASSYAVVSAQGDRMEQDDVDRIVATLMADTAEPSPFLGPHVAIEAYNALGGIAMQLRPSDAAAALDAFDTVAAADCSTHVDDAYSELLSGVYISSDTLRTDVASRLGRLLAVDDRASDGLRALRRIAHLGGPVGPVVEHLAEAGNEAAADALVLLGIDKHPAIDAVAERRAARALARSVHDGGQSWGLFAGFGLGHAQLEALDPDTRHALLDHMVVLAEDEKDLAGNRANAARVLGAAAGLVDESRRARITEQLIVLAAGTKPSAGDMLQLSTQHPLSRMKINFPFEIVQTTSIRAAAYLADSPDERDRVAALAVSLASEGGRNAHLALADVASVLGEPQFTAAALALSPSRDMRRAAAHIYSRDPSSAQEVGLKLAADHDIGVRRELARLLERAWAVDPAAATGPLSILERDPSAEVRLRAAHSCPPASRSSRTPVADGGRVPGAAWRASSSWSTAATSTPPSSPWPATSAPPAWPS